MKDIRVGRLGGLDLIMGSTAWIGAVVLWALLAAGGYFILKVPLMDALVGALAASILHFASEMIHQFGHAIAARRVGYPMTGMRFWGVLASSLYPPDEPDLPPATHIRRALGGIPMSAVVALIGAALAVITQPLGGVVWAVILFFALDNLIVFTFGSLLPLGFTDGSTLLHYWRK